MSPLQGKPYHIILMDIQMPEIDGLEATRQILQNSSLKFTPYIIALTAQALPEDIEIAQQVGMRDYITKPFKLEQLKTGLERAILFVNQGNF